ncbi:MAG TPA: TIGR03617 family F420-dependent LLM class oxidoreductase [Candidatus Binatia bacterium]|nr:TIGR03617 family F420-dependent LLM class oxidoreductase [Candidatus Binatia bacterium]
MKIDGPLLATSLTDIPAAARAQQQAGYDGLFTFDGPVEPFLPLALAAEHTRCDLMTGVAVALARTPMVVAQLAHALALTSDGRFLLGLGSQIRPHIERRFSMPADRPVSRMKDFVRALRAIFACWNQDAPLRYEGEFYRHTMMPPLMKPLPCPHGAPPILLAGVGEPMLRAAGEVADGVILHPFHSRRYLETVALPAIAAGRAAAEHADGASARGFTIACQVLVVTGADDLEAETARAAVRHQLGFYGSTPAYLPVLAAEGWAHLQPELRQLTRDGAWSRIGALVTDEMIDRFAIVGTPAQVGRELVSRYRDVAARVGIATPLPLSSRCARGIIEAAGR